MARSSSRRKRSKRKKKKAAARKRAWWLRMPGLLAALLVGGALVFAFDLTTVDGGAMRPGLQAGDLVLVDRVGVEIGRPEVGDVVLVRDPSDRERELLARVVAVEDDVVRVTRETLFVNGDEVALVAETSASPALFADARPLPADASAAAAVEGEAVRLEALPNGSSHRIVARQHTLASGARAERVEVPKSHVFVLGDNRSAAFDSRAFGPLPEADVVGYVRLIVRTNDPQRGVFGRWLGLVD